MAGSATVEIDGPIARIVFANPDEGLMDETMERALLSAVQDVEASEEVRVCIMTSASPGVFIRHYDIKILRARAGAMREKGYVFTEDRPIGEGPLHTAMRAMEGGCVVYLAALNGSAMGGGFELALAADIRLVAQGAHMFGLPEINLGLLPGAGGTQRLPRLIGLSPALEMMLTGRLMNPDEMTACGLAAGAADDVEALAKEYAARLAAKPHRALAHIKRLARGAPGPDPMGAERALFCDLMVSEDALRLMEDAARGGRVITDEP